jgi:heptaprenyl diphosphate synthase
MESLGLPQVARDMTLFEPMLADSVVVGDPYLDQITTHLILAGGKRLRPLLSLASATGGSTPATPEDLMGGIAVELMHLASLYHDDVMDEAAIRRTVDSVNARYGNVVAIVAGDFLMARSAAIAADLGTDVSSLLAQTLAQLTQGQVSEVRTAFDIDRTRHDYYDAIKGKTASLMAAACRVGGLTSNKSTDELDALTAYGTSLGLIFQLRDDILDITAINGELGKPAGQDLAEGIYTLPVLVALEDASVANELRSLLGEPLDEPEREKARSLVAHTNGVAETLEAARAEIARCHEMAAELSSKELQVGFTSLASSLLDVFG